MTPTDTVVIVEIKAGKLIHDGKLLKPDPRRGSLRAVRSLEDGLTRVQWVSRELASSGGEVEEDIVVFPQEAKLEKIPNQRALVLKFPLEKDRTQFFWIQEPKETEDERLRREFQEALDHLDPIEVQDPTDMNTFTGADKPQGPTVGQLPGSIAQMDSAMTEQAPLGANTMQASQLAQLLSGMAPSSSNQSPSIAEALAAALLAGMKEVQQRQEVAHGPTLLEVLKPEVVTPLLRDPDVLARLAAYLPEEHRDLSHLESLVHSPQFQQQLQTFSMALQTGQLDLQQFGLNAQGFTVADFLSAIQESVDKEGRPGPPVEEEEKDKGGQGDAMQE